MLKIFRSDVYYYQGKSDEALSLMEEVLEQNPQMDGIRPLYAQYLAGVGRNDEAKAQLNEEVLSVSRSDHDMAYWVGSTYAILGDKDASFKWLNRAVTLGNENKPRYETDVKLNSLRDDPRFNELLNRIGVE